MFNIQEHTTEKVVLGFGRYLEGYEEMNFKYFSYPVLKKGKGRASKYYLFGSKKSALDYTVLRKISRKRLSLHILQKPLVKKLEQDILVLLRKHRSILSEMSSCSYVWGMSFTNSFVLGEWQLQLCYRYDDGEQPCEISFKRWSGDVECNIIEGCLLESYPDFVAPVYDIRTYARDLYEIKKELKAYYKKVFEC